MQLEAQERLTEAAAYYEHVLSEDQTNIVLLKASYTNLDGMETSSGPSSIYK